MAAIGQANARLASDFGRSNAMSPLGSNVTMRTAIFNAQSPSRTLIQMDRSRVDATDRG